MCRITKDGAGLSCRGLNHSDSAATGRCDDCNQAVALIRREGKRDYLANVGYHNGGQYYYCFSVHHCDPTMVELWTAAKAEILASGEIVKGQTVTVVKGRKVPKGTTGIVFWVGENQWGPQVGFKADGETYFTALGNVESKGMEK